MFEQLTLRRECAAMPEMHLLKKMRLFSFRWPETGRGLSLEWLARNERAERQIGTTIIVIAVPAWRL